MRRGSRPKANRQQRPLQSARAVGYDYRVDLGLVAVFLVEAFFRLGDEMVVHLVFYEVDRAAAETAAHDARSGHAALLGYGCQEVELLAADLVILDMPQWVSYMRLPTVS